jgi:transcriptional regulator with XRE-family HTH domain
MGVSDDIDDRIAARLRALRTERGWSLEDLAQQSGVSRATLSRLENAEVSATAATLGRLCAAYGLAVSRLMFMAEDQFMPVVRRDEQPVWKDPEQGFIRRSVSPPAGALAGEVVESRLAPGAVIAYEMPPRPGLEHHVVMVEGGLTITVDGQTHQLASGDCLRYQLQGESRFAASQGTGARYLLFMV